MLPIVDHPSEFLPFVHILILGNCFALARTKIIAGSDSGVECRAACPRSGSRDYWMLPVDLRRESGIRALFRQGQKSQSGIARINLPFRLQAAVFRSMPFPSSLRHSYFEAPGLPSPQPTRPPSGSTVRTQCIRDCIRGQNNRPSPAIGPLH